jgi:hypothetical protein
MGKNLEQAGQKTFGKVLYDIRIGCYNPFLLRFLSEQAPSVFRLDKDVFRGADSNDAEGLLSRVVDSDDLENLFSKLRTYRWDLSQQFSKEMEGKYRRFDSSTKLKKEEIKKYCFDFLCQLGKAYGNNWSLTSDQRAIKLRVRGLGKLQIDEQDLIGGFRNSVFDYFQKEYGLE